ncbi:MAG: hypothetical protein FWE57_09180 [Chitinispirillia bacterium]|nr:hypothetical protein [Chitinispirillia bacterium]
MNSVNVNTSVVNLPTATYHQSEVHRTPMVHQQQNADIERDRFDRQMRAAQEAEESKGKIVDPKDRREEKKRNSKKREQELEEERKKAQEEDVLSDTGGIAMSDNGKFVDLSA